MQVSYTILFSLNVICGQAISQNRMVTDENQSRLAGIAESLPKARPRIAGVLRLTALLMLGCLLAIVAFAPEFITG